MDKLKSLKLKLKNVDLKGLQRGEYFFKHEDPEIEQVAIGRAKICSKCLNSVPEPIKSFQVEDDRIPAMSNKMCGACGCIQPFMIRDVNKQCKDKKW